jgi:predicted CoA-binding protein
MRARVATHGDIDAFYAEKRLAVVGVSRNEKDYSRSVFAELRKRGYDVVPVNPNASEIDGVRCEAKLADITPAPDAALVLLPAGPAAQAMRECADAGIKRVWLRYNAEGAEEISKRAGINLISGYCPFMFMPDTHFAHKIHGFCLQLVGQYPQG